MTTQNKKYNTEQLRDLLNKSKLKIATEIKEDSIIKTIIINDALSELLKNCVLIELKPTTEYNDLTQTEIIRYKTTSYILSDLNHVGRLLLNKELIDNNKISIEFNLNNKNCHVLEENIKYQLEQIMQFFITKNKIIEIEVNA